MGKSGKVAVSINDHEVITYEELERLYRWSVSYNIGGSGKNAVSIDHHNHVT